MELKCPFCHKQLSVFDNISYIDYLCPSQAKDHHYAERHSNMNDFLKSKIKIRLSPTEDKLFLRVHLDDNYSEIWTEPGNLSNAIRINHAIEVDFNELSKLENKLRTYIMLS